MTTVSGSPTNDSLIGTADDDMVLGGDGSDTLHGMDGSDTIEGGGGSDTIYGGAGDDLIYGGGTSSLSNIWAVDDQGNLVRIDVVDGVSTSTVIGSTGDIMGDIAVAPDGQLYAVTQIANQILHIDPETGEATPIGFVGTGFPVLVESFAFHESGRAYINMSEGIGWFDLPPPGSDPDEPNMTYVPAGTLPAGFETATDILIVGDTMYIAARDGSDNIHLLRSDLDGAGNLGGFDNLGLLPPTTRGLAQGPEGSMFVLDDTGAYSFDTPTDPGTDPIPVTFVPGSEAVGPYYGATSTISDASADADDADSIEGGQGNDTIYGETGADTILGGEGDDSLFGGDGDDRLYGGNGNDTVWGEAGNDTISGGGGADTLYGGDGDDLIHGGGADIYPTVIWANDGDGNLFRLEMEDGATTPVLVGNTGEILGDIAMSPDGVLYGIGLTFDSILYVIDTNDASMTPLASLAATLPFGANSLSFDELGFAYVGSGGGGDSDSPEIYRFHPSDPSGISLWWTNPDGGFPSGDFVFTPDAAYVAWSTMDGVQQLYRINLDAANDPVGYQLLGTLPDFAYGMTAGADGTLYVLGTDENFVSHVYSFTPPSGPIDGGNGPIPVTEVPGAAGAGWYYDATSNAEALIGAVEDAEDYIEGGDGNDTIFGEAGDDTIYGGNGNDLVYGGDGDDHIHITAGADTVYGGAGRDTIYITGDSFFGSVIDGDEDGDDFDSLNLADWANNYGSFFVDYDPDNSENGTVLFYDSNGIEVGQITFNNIENIICFARGTRIRTPDGEVNVEELVAGRDSVLTVDNQAQPIMWIGQRYLDSARLAVQPELRPIRIRQGALGPGLPEHDLLVSPQHRVLVRSRTLSRIAGVEEGLVAAKHLVGAPGISVDTDVTEVEYWHFLCRGHELVWSNGAVTETLHTGAEAMKSLTEAARQEIYALFPELADPTLAEHRPAVRYLIRGKEGRNLTRRHIRNGKAFQPADMQPPAPLAMSA